jgi:hypothetical protein
MTKGGKDEAWAALGARLRVCGAEVSEVALDELSAAAEHAESADDLTAPSALPPASKFSVT